MKDLYSKILPVISIVPAVLAADNTPVAVDRQGFNSLVYEIAIGAGGITFDATNRIDFKLTESDDDSTYNAVADADIIGLGTGRILSTVGTGGIVLSLIAAHASGTVDKVGYIGNKRYTKMLADFSGTHGTGTAIYASAIKGNPNHAPV